MSLELLMVGLLPLLIFVFVEWRYGLKSGVWAAILLSVALGIYFYLAYGIFDLTLVFELVLIIALGALALRFNNSRLIKFQPVAVALVFAGYFFFMQIWDQPVLVRWLPMMEPMAPQIAELRRWPRFVECLGGTSLVMAWVILGHGLATLWAALFWTTMVWFLVRLSIYPLLLIPALYMQVCLRSP